MMWLAVMGACWLGAVALSGDDKKSSSTHVNHDVASNTRKYTVQYVRENLDEWYYSKFGMHLKYNLNNQCIQRICKIIIICTLIMLL